MLPEICHIGPFTIYSYGVMLVLAFFTATSLCSAQARREKMDPDLIFNLLFIIFISGIIGCRVFYVLLNFSYYLRNPLEIIMLQHGGMAWFGGLIFGSISGFLFIKRNKLDFLKIADLVVPFVALGQSIGRIGCLLNGCCFGRESQWGVYSEVFGKVLIPTQLYSSLLLLLIFCLLRLMQNNKHLPGLILYSYLFFYSLKRLFIEFLRNDSPRIIFGLTLFQLLSTAVFIFSLLRIIRMSRKFKK
ncbi:MAG: prolipoprotein diacylglyceryl transferase [Candidatus Omnitrophota bacterium]